MKFSAAKNLFGALASLLVVATSQAQLKVVAYVPNWVDLRTFAESIDYSKITHINIAFENPTNAEGDLSFHPQDEFLIAKARTNHVKVLVSIGGGSASTNKKLQARYFSLIGEGKRAGFAAKLADYISNHNLDGVDVDIEGPSINQDYGGFIEELGKSFKANGKLLTAALSKGYGGSKVPNSVFEHFDFVNIMAYDGAGYWAPQSPGQHSSLEYAKSGAAYWLNRGLPKLKAILGLPFYGYGFGDAFRKGVYSYSEILGSHPGAENADQAGHTIWYNGIPTIKAKCKYVIDEQLGGVMIWSLDNDVKDERSLLSAIHETLRSNSNAPAR